jgi:hypothetical protein
MADCVEENKQIAWGKHTQYCLLSCTGDLHINVWKAVQVFVSLACGETAAVIFHSLEV